MTFDLYDLCPPPCDSHMTSSVSDAEPVSGGEPSQRRSSPAAPSGGCPAAGVTPPSTLGGWSEPLEEEQSQPDCRPVQVSGGPDGRDRQVQVMVQVIDGSSVTAVCQVCVCR